MHPILDSQHREFNINFYSTQIISLDQNIEYCTLENCTTHKKMLQNKKPSIIS
jgi:hypothetical protein